MNADRNLLFGILALQNDFVTRDELVAAMNDWVLEKQTPLGEILRRRGALAEDVFGLLDALVDKQLAKHQGDVQASIAALSSVTDARLALNEIADEQVQATLRTLQPPADAGMPGTEPFFGKSADEAGRFTILRPHAAGGLGEVFVAKDNELDREVALKQIKEQYSQSSQSQSRFKLEAEVTGGLEHPGIVPVYSLGSYADGRPFYAMRFIRGDSLKEAIDQFHRRAGGKPDYASLEFRGLLRRFIDVCNAIAYAHSRGILHRDLKPGNIMLGKYGETLVVDWGLAKAMGSTPTDHEVSQGPLMPPSASGSGYEATAAGSAIGTPAYMSPEQAEGRITELGPATDVYSLGATLYTVLTGKPPFVGNSVAEILQHVREGMFTSPRQIQPRAPKAVVAICLRAMALVPDDRYRSADDVTKELERWLADEPVSALREPTTVHIARWVRKHAALSAGLAASIVVALFTSTVALAVIGAKNRDLTMARDTAETEFRRAKKAIDDYFTAVSESNELKEKYPGMHAFRLKLLEKAQAYYEEFLKERGNDPNLQADAARAFSNRAFIANETGRTAEALASYQAALRIRGKLVRTHPTAITHAADFARSHLGLGNLQDDLGRPYDALISYRTALKIRERLALDNPSIPQCAKDLADSHNNLGNLQKKLGKLHDALASYQEALKIREKLTHDYPSRTVYAADLAASYNCLGLLKFALGKPVEALDSYQAALKIQEQIAHDNPGMTRYAADLALSHNNLGAQQFALGKWNDALASNRHALKIREKLARDNPSVTAFAVDLAKSHNNLGAVQSNIGKGLEALASYQAAIKTLEKVSLENPNAPEYATSLAASHSNLGACQSALGKPHDALASYQASLKIRAKLVHNHPDVAAYYAGLARSHNNVGTAQCALGKFSDALDSYQVALKIQEKLARGNPAVTEYATDLGRSYYNLGVFELECKSSPKQSLSRFDNAIEALVGPSKVDASAHECLRNSHWARAMALASLERFDEALADYDAALRFSINSNVMEIRAGRDIALAKKAARTKTRAEASDEKPVGESKSSNAKAAEKKAPKE